MKRGKKRERVVDVPESLVTELCGQESLVPMSLSLVYALKVVVRENFGVNFKLKAQLLLQD